MRIKAFTLIELLVVVSIITLLIAILLPALSAAREKAIVVTCLSRLRQVSTASTMYAMDNKQTFPDRGSKYTYLPHCIVVGPVDLNKTFFLPYLQDRDRMAFCPGKVNEVRGPDVHVNYVKNYITYQYFNNRSSSWASARNSWLADPPDITTVLSRGTLPLWGCLTVEKRLTGAWLSHDVPEVDILPEGMNTTCVDGSAQWYPWPTLESYWVTTIDNYYWPRSDY